MQPSPPPPPPPPPPPAESVDAEPQLVPQLVGVDCLGSLASRWRWSTSRSNVPGAVAPPVDMKVLTSLPISALAGVACKLATYQHVDVDFE